MVVRCGDEELERDAAALGHLRRHALDACDFGQARANRIDLDPARDEFRRRCERDAPLALAGSFQVSVGGPAGRRRRRRRRHGRQPRHACVDRGRCGVQAPRLDDLFEGRRPVDERLEPGRRQPNLFAPNRAEITLHLVRQPLGLAQLDHRGDALQRVEAAEELLDERSGRVGVADRGLEQQQRPPHGREMLLGLGKVVVHEGRDEVIWPLRHRASRPARGVPCARAARRSRRGAWQVKTAWSCSRTPPAAPLPPGSPDRRASSVP